MKPSKRVIHIVKHSPTGAEVPVIIKKMSKNNVVEDYSEWIHERKGFTIKMLCNRWDKCADDVIELLQEYQIPGHLNHQEVQQLPQGTLPVSVALFFSEYIYALESKINLPHNKLKPISPKVQKDH